MRIAVYHNQPPGGARRALHGFCDVLARRHRVDIFKLATADDSMLNDLDYGGTVTTLPYEASVPIRRGLVLNDLREWQAHARLDEVNREAAARIDAGNYDVALVDACRFTFAPQLLRHLRTPSVYYCHHGPWRADGVSELQARSAYENARHAAHMLFRRRLEMKIRNDDRELTRRATAVATNSEYSRKRILETCGIDAEVCPPGIPIPPLHPRQEGGHILSVGDLVPHKGHDLVIRALATVPEEGRPELHIVANFGGRTYTSRLSHLARDLGVRLVIRQAISNDDLDSEYRGACVYAFGARREPLGLAPVEAMAHELPVVAVAEGGVLETVVDGTTGFVVSPDAAAMGEKLARLMNDASLRRSMGKAGRLAVEKMWSCETRTVKLEGLLLRTAAAALSAVG
jgi:glycosyltransferase involved in cell wall biosynthesis